MPRNDECLVLILQIRSTYALNDTNDFQLTVVILYPGFRYVYWRESNAGKKNNNFGKSICLYS